MELFSLRPERKNIVPVEMDLSKVKCNVATVPWNTERHSRIMPELEYVGIRDVKFHYGQKTKDYWRGATDTYYTIIKESPLPVLVVEDDATVVPKNFKLNFMYPNIADVIYLGCTLNACYLQGSYVNSEHTVIKSNVRSGGPGVTKNRLVYELYDEQYARIFNMHSGHAILIVSETGRRVFVRAIEEMRRTQPFDVAFSMRMARCLTLSMRKPFWYQQDGRNDQVTNIELN
jgi:hypothetical protein